MSAVDSEKLLAHLAREQQTTRSGVVLAFADDLEARVRRGDFDLEPVPA